MEGKIISDNYIFADDGKYYKINQDRFLLKKILQRNDDIFFTPDGEFAVDIVPIYFKNKIKKIDKNIVFYVKTYGILTVLFLFLYQISNFFILEIFFISLYFFILYKIINILEIYMQNLNLMHKFKFFIFIFPLVYMIKFYDYLNLDDINLMISHIKETPILMTFIIIISAFFIIINFLIYMDLARIFDLNFLFLYGILGGFSLIFSYFIIISSLIHLIAWIRLRKEF